MNGLFTWEEGWKLASVSFLVVSISHPSILRVAREALSYTLCPDVNDYRHCQNVN